MNALLFKELSDASEYIQIHAGKPLYESFPDLDDKIILVNGDRKTKDYIPKEGDLVAIRSIPRAPAVFYIVVLAVAVAGAIYVGYQSYQMKKQIEKMKERMENMRDEIVNVPYLKGARNSVATGRSQPYIIGEHLFTPYLLSKGYRKISGAGGADQYYYVVLEGGFNKQVLRKVYCDDIVLKDFGTSETVPQEGIYTFDEASPFYDADSLIEIAQDGNAFATAEFNSRVDISEPGATLKKSDDAAYEDLLFTLPQYARSFNMVLMFNGLRAFDPETGVKINRSVRVVPAYSLDSGANWVPFTWSGMGDGYTITGNTNRQLRYNVTQSFTWGQVGALTEPVLVRLQCTTAAFDGTAYDECYVEYIQSAIYNPDKSADASAFVDESILDDPERALSTLIGLKIKATTSNADKLDRINIITSGVARTWNGTAWSATKVPTSNPAAWALEVLTSPSHKPSQTADADVDLDSFGDWYESCATADLCVDMALIEGDTKENVVNMIAQVGYAAIYDNIYGKKAVAVDEAKPNAICVINPQNVMSFSCEKDMGRKVDGLKMSFVNREGGYVQDSYLVLRPGHTRTANSIFRDISVTGIVRYDQIVSYARRLMAVEELRPRSVAIKVGHEGIYYTPLSKMLVQHSALANGLGTGSEIKAIVKDGFSILGVELYDPIDYDSTNVNGYGVVINCVSDTYSSTIAREYTAATNGKVYEIEFETPIPLDDPVIPHVGDILSYGYLNAGEFDTVTTPMLVTSIEPDSDGYALALVDYNEAIYDVGDYPAYTPNMTEIAVPTPVPEDVPPATLDDVADVAESIPARVPGYRGRYYGIHPTTYSYGDWWLVYNDEGATGGDNVPRGIYYAPAGVVTLIDPTDTNVLLTKYRATTLDDVLWASNNGYTLIGTENDPVAVYGVTVMQYLAVNAAFINYLGTNIIRLSSSGALIGGSRYNNAGTIIDAAATGVFIGADGTVKFESAKGGLVIDSATGTVTYTGINIDLTDSALVSYEEGSATPKSFSHENLALVVRDFASAEKVRLQYENETGLWGGRGLGGEVDFIATWFPDIDFGASTEIDSTEIHGLSLAMNRGQTAIAIASKDLGGSELELVEYIYNGTSWSGGTATGINAPTEFSITKMTDGRHMIVFAILNQVSYCIRATDGTYSEPVLLQANAYFPTVATLPTGLTVCAYIHIATDYIGRKAWSGTEWGTDTSIELAAKRPEFNVTEEYATLTYILSSTNKAFVIDCTAGTFPAATDTTVTALHAQCQILPDLTYRLVYRLSTGHLYAAVGASLTSWTATALETSGVTDFYMGILGTGETTLLYAKSSLLRRVDASAYAGTNETKLMRAGMGFVESGTDALGKYFKTPDGSVFRDETFGQTLIAGTNLYAKMDVIRQPWQYTTYARAAMYHMTQSGVVTVYFQLSGFTGYMASYGRIYVNGVAVGKERANNTTAYRDYYEDITVAAGDDVEIYVKYSGVAITMSALMNCQITVGNVLPKPLKVDNVEANSGTVATNGGVTTLPLSIMEIGERKQVCAGVAGNTSRALYTPNITGSGYLRLSNGLVYGPNVAIVGWGTSGGYSDTIIRYV